MRSILFRRFEEMIGARRAALASRTSSTVEDGLHIFTDIA